MNPKTTLYSFNKKGLACILSVALIGSALAMSGTAAATDHNAGVRTLSSTVSSKAVHVVIDGSRRSFPQPAIIKDGRTLVPLRGIFEALGASVRWDQATQTVSATKENTTVILRIGQSTASVNGQTVTLAGRAEVIGGSTMVPLRFVSEALGANVHWDARTSTAIIHTGTGGAGSEPAQETPGGETTFATQVANLVNEARSQAGLSPLAFDQDLARVALDKAKDMKENNYFDHESPTYGSPFEMMRAYNITYSYAGENIASGQRTAEEVTTAWMNSPGHRANILSKNFTKIGVGYYNGYWVQLFTG
ncbi:stalk domain-containing protein [Paenibacillus sp. 1P07SE]|uniref:stalk domain-containing protein n=1 Tax=Paenibacillus sp. 1P07SE TaxID=3132209 RepID=UPI0039A57725